MVVSEAYTPWDFFGFQLGCFLRGPFCGPSPKLKVGNFEVASPQLLEQQIRRPKSSLHILPYVFWRSNHMSMSYASATQSGITCATTRPRGELRMVEGCPHMNPPSLLYHSQLTTWESCGTSITLCPCTDSISMRHHPLCHLPSVTQ